MKKNIKMNGTKLLLNMAYITDLTTKLYILLIENTEGNIYYIALEEIEKV